jgi:hypothetical protein
MRFASWSLLLLMGCITMVCADMTTDDWINVKDYGAKGDGKADDWAIIQRCINTINAYRQSGVYLPPGDYRCTKTIVLWTGVTLRGQRLFTRIVSEATVGIAFWSREGAVASEPKSGMHLPAFGPRVLPDLKTGNTPTWQIRREGKAQRPDWACAGVTLDGIRVETVTGQMLFGAHTMGLSTYLTVIKDSYFYGRVAGLVVTGNWIGCTIRDSIFHPGLWFLADRKDGAVINTSKVERVHVGCEHGHGSDYAVKLCGSVQMFDLHQVTFQGRRRGVLVDLVPNSVCVSIDGVYGADMVDLAAENPVGANADKYRYGPIVDIRKAPAGLILRNVMACPSMPILIADDAGPVLLENCVSGVITHNPNVTTWNSKIVTE